MGTSNVTHLLKFTSGYKIETSLDSYLNIDVIKKSTFQKDRPY